MTVSTTDKKLFLHFFLKNYQLKHRECVWILNYIATHDDVLEKVHFVDNITACLRAMMMSTICTDEKPFIFYKNQVKTEDVSKSFHDIRMNKTEDIFILLHFKFASTSPQYAAVLEENPFINHQEVDKQTKMDVDEILTNSLFEFRKKRLQMAVDSAIDKRNAVEFYQLSEELNQLKKQVK